MITTRRAPRNQRLLAAAFVLSILVHLFGGALWARAAHTIAAIMHRLPEQHPREEEIATSDTIHLEKRTVPRPATRSRAQTPSRHALPRRPAVPAPRAPVLQPARPAPAARAEIAHLVKRAAVANAPVKHVPVSARKPDIAKAPGTRAAAAPKAALSAARIAALDAQFARTIASSHVDLATIQKQTEERPVATKRYPLQFAGMQANLQRGEGYISPITPGQRIGGTVWYYTHYTYMWPDGHLEDDDIPWPFRFPVQQDLFALHVRLIPLQLPPPGFRLNRPLKPFLAHFLQTATG